MNATKTAAATSTPLTSEEVFEALGFTPATDLSTIATVSGKIRALTAAGKTRSEIAKTLNIRYQHVRNVQLQPLKKDGNK